jgi:hypothetical protein
VFHIGDDDGLRTRDYGMAARRRTLSATMEKNVAVRAERLKVSRGVIRSVEIEMMQFKLAGMSGHEAASLACLSEVATIIQRHKPRLAA